MSAKFSVEGTRAFENLIAGDFPRVTRKVTIAAFTGTYAVGTVMGKITAGGEYNQSLSAAADGSQVPEAILLEEVTDDGSGGQQAIIAETGEYNESGIALGTAHTVASVRAGLRDKGIFLHKVI